MAGSSGERGKRAGRSDDAVLPFATVRSRVGGRIARLGGTVDTILTRHDYPAPVAQALGEALALTALLGNMLKIGSKLILQTKTDGALDMLVINYEAPGGMRGYASHDAAQLAALTSDRAIAQGALLGCGHLAMTIDPGGNKPSSQGIVALSGQTLCEAAHAYFRQSEQLPTFIRLAVARHYTAGEGSVAGAWGWRAGGLMVQQTPSERDRAAPGGESVHLVDEDGEDWRRVRLLAATVEDHELLDPTLAPEWLLYRLFHEEGVRVGAPTQLVARCRCSRERVEMLLRSFGAAELDSMREPDGGFTVTCEFCSTKYRFAAREIG
jgi:molecular chaperone Hsp33